MADLTDAEKLAEAETALHRLLTGSNVVTARYGDREVTYRNYASDIANLRAYIAELKGKVDPTTARRPFRFIW